MSDASRIVAQLHADEASDLEALVAELAEDEGTSEREAQGIALELYGPLAAFGARWDFDAFVQGNPDAVSLCHIVEVG